jgi:lysophospholipase L1-like esterase
MSKPITFAILGDSAATGVGDYDQFGRPRGWCFHLASAFSQPVNLIQVARSGAQSSEVREIQLPRALAHNPDIAALVVGGNDLLRNGFNPQRLYENLSSTITEFKSRGAEVFLRESFAVASMRLTKSMSA